MTSYAILLLYFYNFSEMAFNDINALSKIVNDGNEIVPEAFELKKPPIPRKKRATASKCGVCGQTGHNKRSCKQSEKQGMHFSVDVVNLIENHLISLTGVVSLHLFLIYHSIDI